MRRKRPLAENFLRGLSPDMNFIIMIECQEEILKGEFQK
jgi:hypothetical protein